MSSEAIATVVKMMESLPEPARKQIVDHLRNYLMEVQNELRWDKLLTKLTPSLLQWLNWQKSKLRKVKLAPWIMTSYEISVSSILLGCLQESGTKHQGQRTQRLSIVDTDIFIDADHGV